MKTIAELVRQKQLDNACCAMYNALGRSIAACAALGSPNCEAVKEAKAARKAAYLRRVQQLVDEYLTHEKREDEK